MLEDFMRDIFNDAYVIFFLLIFFYYKSICCLYSFELPRLVKAATSQGNEAVNPCPAEPGYILPLQTV